MSKSPTIIYTKTDEAPALATYAFLPVIEAFAAPAGVNVETRDISLAGRILAVFPDGLGPEQKVHDALSELGELAKTADANIIKLPNISASIPQMKACIAELQKKGFALPDYPEEPKTDAEREAKARYDKVKGSAVNPVLREGNSDRRAPKAVKEYARKNPHSMGAWSSESKTHVATMGADDFRANEKSVVLSDACVVRIEHDSGAEVTILKDGLKLDEGEVLDGTFMSKKALVAFLEREVQEANEQGVLFSLHMKATMMKVSDPIIFGHAVKVFFADVFEKYGDAIDAAGGDPRNGFGDVLAAVESMDEPTKGEIKKAIAAAYESGPSLAMVDSDRGITNLHVPSDVIIDASMPAMIRTSGQMWNAAGDTQDCKATIPDSSYAAVYQTVIDDCKANGAYDPTTMGSVSNVGLMAQKAEEYGSHDKTFEIPADGVVRVVDDNGKELTKHEVAAGDVWRMCQVKDAPVRDWVKLAVTRAKATGVPAVFWLDADRPHDRELIMKVETYLQDYDTGRLELPIMSPAKATDYSLRRIREGKDTISVTGNVLRDYLTDLFPILELGTSAKMLSIVPLMKGGGLYETGAGGSAPKHVQQLVEENHLRWDSLGEFLALAASLDDLASKKDNPKIKALADTLDEATGKLLDNGKGPSRRTGELDNRGSQFYLAMYWAEALAAQDTDAELKAHFSPLAKALADNADAILKELTEVQGKEVDIGGYYKPDHAKLAAVMRPSETLNRIINGD